MKSACLMRFRTITWVMLFTAFSFSLQAAGGKDGFLYFEQWGLLIDEAKLNNDFYPVAAADVKYSNISFAKVQLSKGNKTATLQLFDGQKKLITSISYAITGATSKKKITRSVNNETRTEKLEVFDMVLLD